TRCTSFSTPPGRPGCSSSVAAATAGCTARRSARSAPSAPGGPAARSSSFPTTTRRAQSHPPTGPSALWPGDLSRDVGAERSEVSTMAEVKLDSVTKVFPGGARAVDALSLTVHDGEFLVLVGPSGCGKSTVLRIIAALEDATEGVISIDGKVITDLQPKERDVAMVFQNYALYPHMT